MGKSLSLGGRVVAACALLLASAQAHAPHDVVYELALSPAFASDRTVFAAIQLTDNMLFARSTDAGRSWRYIGTPMAETLVRAFAFSPGFTVDQTVFAATSSGGAWRTKDGGLTWQKLLVPAAVVNDIAVSPNFSTDHRVLAATKFGLFASNDGGDTWFGSGGGMVESNIQRVGLVVTGAGTLMAFAAGSTFHLSLNGGASWVPKGVFSKPVMALSISPSFASDRRIAIGFGKEPLGVALSIDAGATFQWINTGLIDLAAEDVALATDGSIYAATAGGGAFRANTPGSPWQLLVSGLEDPSPLTEEHNTEIAPSPAIGTDDTVFLGGFEGVYRSGNQGAHWLQLDLYSQLLNRRFVFAPQFASDRQILTGNYGGGVFHYSESPPLQGGPGATLAGGSGLGLGAMSHSGPTAKPVPLGAASLHAWEPRSTNLNSPWSASLVASPGAPGQRRLLYGYSNLVQSIDEGHTWFSAHKPPGLDVVRALAFSPNFDVDDTIFLGSGMAGSYRSTDGCQSWQPLAGLPPFLSATAIAISPGWSADGTVLFASRNFGIWRSTDGGWNWLQSPTTPATVYFKALVVSPDFTSDGFALAGSFGAGIFASHDGGATWAAENGNLPTAQGLKVESLVFSPAFAVDRTVFAAFQNQGVWRSTDGAQSWEPTGPGLPAPPVEIGISPTYAQDRTLVVGTFGGTFISRDRGTSWQPMPGYVRADDAHPVVHYDGASWKLVASSGDLVGTCTVADTLGNACWLEFYGRNIAWYGETGPDGALAEVTVDDGAPQFVDTFSPTTKLQQRLFHVEFQTPGWHVVRVQHAGPTSDHINSFKLRSDGFSYEW